MTGFGIVGCGHIAAKHAAAIQETEGAELKAVCDRNPERLKPFEKRGVSGYITLGEMLADPNVDVVNICTPSGLHADMAIQAACAGKHVVVEKPMALTLQDADAMIEVCHENGVLLTVVHPNRFRPAMQLLKQRVETGAFGKLGHVSATLRWNRNQAYFDQDAWRGTCAMDGGVLMNQGIHQLDLLLWLLGEVEEVFSYEATRIRSVESADTSLSVMRFKSGLLGVVEAAVTVYPRNLEESLALFGESGTAVIKGRTANQIQTWQFADLSSEEEAQLIRKVRVDALGESGHRYLIQKVVKALREGGRPPVTGYEGRNAVALAIACQKAAETGRSVRLDSLIEKRGEIR
ncbi:Gfo/Idh/MocA family oxidoreductase [Kroppenstedtia pulmonis]|uniref:Gfo/Idh/MocA family oxidoreductase n=1 Tax=Kroppenstedtia pulmonis TaxID=1380685 RepID=A0A7D4BRM7_9BACL|nr:Gfo/Idh/MocA family oxidoreductase [Kroppenstedtia pulmonis]QKG85691.1 Gfo/Idh/MocA family oxidoreductase [Kroppenstedtia pulmonis]